jgi:histidinol-phosphate aminotransferase
VGESSAPERATGLPEGLVRAALEGVQAYQPGRPIGDVQRELGLDSVVKLASNEGPFPPMPGALEAIARAGAEARLYPDAGAWELRDALSGRLGLPAEAILPGAGIDGLIRLLTTALLDPGDELAMGWPSFVSWRQAAQIQGATVRTAPLGADGAYDLQALAAEIGPRTKLAVVVSPNNPTGAAVSAAALEAFLDALPGHVLAVLDEAYFEYLPPGGHDGAALVAQGRPLAVLRTFSKAYGLAGLRVGYLVGTPELVRTLGLVRLVFDVTAPAQAAAVASLAEADRHLPERMRLNVAERGMLEAGLRALALAPLPSSANFVLVDVGSPERAEALNQALLRQGVIVRPARAFGAPASLRISVGWPHENARALAALAGALAEVG